MDEKKVYFTPGPWMKGKPVDAIIASPEAEIKMIGKPFPEPEKEVREYYGGHVICESVNAYDRDLIIAAPEMHKTLSELIIALKVLEKPNITEQEAEMLGTWILTTGIPLIEKVLCEAEGRST